MGEITLSSEIEAEFEDVCGKLTAAAATLVAQKLISPWSGQVSARLQNRLLSPSSDAGDDLIAVSRSGYSFTFGLITGNGAVVRMGGKSPSVGHPVHIAIYRARPEVGAVVRFRGLYTDTLSTVLGRIPLALETFWCLRDEPAVLPVDQFESDTVQGFIAKMTDAVIETARSRPEATVVSVAYYGAWAWGRDLDEACMRAQAVEEFSERAYARMCLARALDTPIPTMPEWLVRALTPHHRPTPGGN